LVKPRAQQLPVGQRSPSRACEASSTAPVSMNRLSDKSISSQSGRFVVSSSPVQSRSHFPLGGKTREVVSPEQFRKSKKQVDNFLDEEYRDIESALKSARYLANEIAGTFRLPETNGSWIRSPARSIADETPTKIIHVDGVSDGASNAFPSFSQTVLDHKQLLAQRDHEIYLLQQNYDLQYQESVILKQQLVDVKQENDLLQQENEFLKKYQTAVAQLDSELYNLKQNYELQYQESVILKQKLIETIQTVDRIEKENETLRKNLLATSIKEDNTVRELDWSFDLQYQSVRAYEILHSSLEKVTRENQQLLGNKHF
jgi:hypothetical protein